jgi:hypothetical protein
MIVADLLALDQKSFTPVRIHFDWFPSDPLSVIMRFPDHGQEWIVGRDLLIDGLTFTVGLGDVTLTPIGADMESIQVIEMRLIRPPQVALFRIDAGELLNFLNATMQVVSLADEPQVCDKLIDLELTHMLGGE